MRHVPFDPLFERRVFRHAMLRVPCGIQTGFGGFAVRRLGGFTILDCAERSHAADSTRLRLIETAARKRRQLGVQDNPRQLVLGPDRFLGRVGCGIVE